jgi:hypothetical protein
LLVLGLLLGCDSGGGGKPAGSAAPGASGAPATATGQQVDCAAVVEKLASYQPGSGEPEKKLWTKMCEAMPPAARSCIVASKTPAERDACIKDQKL